VALRLSHQTKQAFSGIRKSSGHTQSEKQKELSLRQRLIRELDAVAKEQGDIGAGTGVERAVRWTGKHSGTEGKIKGGDATDKPIAGNSANAAAVATASAAAVSDDLSFG